jgi:hypothetical protein
LSAKKTKNRQTYQLKEVAYFLNHPKILCQLFLERRNFFHTEIPGRNWEPESPSLKKKLRVAGGE